MRAGPATDADIQVRLLGEPDVEGAVETLVRAFNEFNVSAGLPPTFNTFSQARSSIRMAMQLDPGRSLVAVRGSKVVGLTVAFRRGGYVSIGPVAVHPLAQGQGVGRSLMRALMDANSDASCFALAHAGTNPHAFTLYRTLGFRVVYPEASFAGVPSTEVAPPRGVRIAGRLGSDEMERIDRKLTAVDRSGELSMLAGLGRVLLADDGYLVTVRLADALAIGPGAAGSPASITALLQAAMQDVPPGGIICRVPANGPAFDVLHAAGLRPESVGNVMAAGEWPARAGHHVHPVFPEVL